MAEKIPIRVQHKRMTKSEWLASKVILLDGEIGVESDTGYIKMGDGKKLFKDLIYVQGPKGDKGDTGPQGPKGATGPKGDRGPQGDKGDTGPRGPQGLKGADGEVTFASLTTAQKESIKGPKGDTGPRGPAGPTGPKGDPATETFTKPVADKYYQPKGNYLTSIPKQYVTESDLDDKSDLKVKDTRNDDRNPLWYMNNYGSKQVFEFKYRKNVGNPPEEASASKNYTIVLTRVPWRDKSGGYPTQLSFGERIALRIGTSETTWGKWKTLATTDDIKSVDVSGQLADYVKKDDANKEFVNIYRQMVKSVGVNKDGVIGYQKGFSWVTLNADSEYHRPLAFKDHTHDEYLKKGDPIQLTSSQKAELKGEKGDRGLTGPRGATGSRGATGAKGADGTSITTWVGTEAQYNALSTKSSTTLYIITE